MADKCGVNEGGSMACAMWFAGWLFSIGFVKFGFWKAVLALLVWPYFLGAALTAAK